MNVTHDLVETNTLKMISNLLKHKQMDEVQKKMQVYRSKPLPYDDDAVLTLKSM